METVTQKQPVTIEEEVKKAHAELKERYRKEMSVFFWFNGLPEGQQEWVIISMIDAYNDGHVKGWFEGHKSAEKIYNA